MTVKFLSLETTELPSGQPARLVTFDVNGERVSRKIAYDTPQEKVDARIRDLANGLAIEFAEASKKEVTSELTTSFSSGEALTE